MGDPLSAADLADWTVRDHLITGADVTDQADWTWTDQLAASAADMVDWTQAEVGAGAGNLVGSFVSSSANVGTSGVGSSVVVAAPTSIAAGNLLIAFYYMYTGTSTPTLTPPAGWSLVSGSHATDSLTAMSVYAKTATGGEPSTYTFSSSVAGSNMVVIVQWAGLATGTDGASATGAVGSSSTWASTGLTAGHQPDTIMLGVGGLSNGQPGPGPYPSSFLGTAEVSTQESHLAVYALAGPTSTTVPAYQGNYAATASHTLVSAVALH